MGERESRRVGSGSSTYVLYYYVCMVIGGTLYVCVCRSLGLLSVLIIYAYLCFVVSRSIRLGEGRRAKGGKSGDYM